MGEPFVLQDGPQYYLYDTDASDGFKAWTSTNLVQWNSGSVKNLSHIFLSVSIWLSIILPMTPLRGSRVIGP